ncbi:mitochondrial translation initiation factor [Catenaria anguillulae PL171]|uniref:Translation machinery-associated protein 22 n=1 Tax=Catenaria anguillulae PL171 TaxID=765915 RepID=A0A1Y2HDA1_9FUNG|nr:mitochondrial translation initiation factor [Catenaria anguillulae PL171]
MPSANPPQIPQEPVSDLFYCGICSLPPEYCEFHPTLKKCKEWLQQNNEELYNQLYLAAVEEGVAAVSLTPAAKPKDASDKLERKLEAAAEKKRKTQVLIKTEKRKGKKVVTVITGLDVFGVDLKAASKLFAQKFATGSSVGKSAEGMGEVVIQGEVPDEVQELIEAKFPDVPADNIVQK